MRDGGSAAEHRLQRTAALPLKVCTALLELRDNGSESCLSRRCR